jgi:NAD(P)H-hydrate epimerase
VTTQPDGIPLPPLPVRDPRGHKGTFGTVAIVGGCALAETRMIGGPALSALAAFRAGAGLVKLAVPEPVMNAAITLAPSATGAPLPVDESGAIIAHETSRVIDRLVASSECLAIGPGLGRGEGPIAASFRAINQEQTPVVVDADAINALAELPEMHRDFRAMAILTPHPGEFRRLAKSMGLSDDLATDDARMSAAESLARTLGCVVVLKGAGTVVSDGQRTWVNSTGNAALATAGTGDVLTGLIAALVAQFHKRPLPAGSRTITSEARGGLSLFDCARLGVAAHGIAAEDWARDRGADFGMLASELADGLPPALARLRGV